MQVVGLPGSSGRLAAAASSLAVTDPSIQLFLDPLQLFRFVPMRVGCSLPLFLLSSHTVNLLIKLHCLLTINVNTGNLQDIPQYLINSLALLRRKRILTILQKSNDPLRLLLIHWLQFVILLHYILQLLIDLPQHPPHSLTVIVLSPK